jgi:hypothetical protein
MTEEKVIVVFHRGLRKFATPVKLVVAATLTVPLLAFGGPVLSAQPAAITVRGTVTTSGHTMPDVKVEIHAWPDQAIVQALKPGQKVPWALVGTAETEADGKFSVSLPLAKLMPEASYGVVNLEADTTSATYSFPVVVTKNDGDAYLAGSPSDVNLVANGDPSCDATGVWVYQGSLGKRWAVVGETYVPTSHATQHFQYEIGQSSSLGVGVSVTDKAGSFDEHGTYSWSSSLKESWPTYGADRSVWYTTQFHWGLYACEGRYIAHPNFEQHVNGYVGGAEIRKPAFVPTTPHRFCTVQTAGSSPTSDTSAAVTWTKHLAISSVQDDAGLGFDASAETGFDHSAELQYTVSERRLLCGWKDYPGGTPRQLVIRR